MSQKFDLSGVCAIAKCISIYDGDTITLELPLTTIIAKFDPVATGVKARVHMNCRMLGYNSAEMRTKNAEEKAAAIAAKSYLESLILDKEVQVTFDKDDMYGRPLVIINLGSMIINNHMIEKGHGIRYDGRGEKLWK